MTEDIRTRPDGSIDTGHYIARGRAARSRAAHDMMAAVPPAAPRRPMAWFSIAGLLAILPFWH